MTFLPIVDRELRVAARNPATQRARLRAALVAGVLVIAMLLIATLGGGAGNLGGGMFVTMAVIAFLYCLFEGTRLAADSLSEEKRDGTLGLLFLTDLKAYDVVLGKLVATSLRSFYGLLAGIPLLAMPLLVGGVTPGEFWRMTLLLIITLFLSLTTGIWVSARSRSDRKAWAATILLLTALSSLPQLLDALMGRSLFSWLSPSFAFSLVFDVRYRTHASEFWLALLVMVLLGWSWIVLACRVLPYSWQDQSITRSASRWHELWERRAHADARQHGDLRKRLIEINPVLWLVARRNDRCLYMRGFVVAAALLPGALAWFGLVGVSASLGFALGSVSFGGFVTHLVVIIWLAAQACYNMSDARRDGVLELLLVTPLKPEEIVRGQYLAIKRLFLGPVVAIILVETIVMLAQFRSGELTGRGPDSWTMVLAYGGVMAAFSAVTFTLDLYAAAAVGLWLGLTERKAAQALAKTLLYVVVAPSLLFCCCLARPVADVLLLAWARNKLMNEFRAVATQPVAYQAAASSWWIFKRSQADSSVLPAGGRS